MRKISVVLIVYLVSCENNLKTGILDIFTLGNKLIYIKQTGEDNYAIYNYSNDSLLTKTKSKPSFVFESTNGLFFIVYQGGSTYKFFSQKEREIKEFHGNFLGVSNSNLLVFKKLLNKHTIFSFPSLKEVEFNGDLRYDKTFVYIDKEKGGSVVYNYDLDKLIELSTKIVLVRKDMSYFYKNKNYLHYSEHSNFNKLKIIRMLSELTIEENSYYLFRTSDKLVLTDKNANILDSVVDVKKNLEYSFFRVGGGVKIFSKTNNVDNFSLGKDTILNQIYFNNKVINVKNNQENYFVDINHEIYDINGYEHYDNKVLIIKQSQGNIVFNSKLNMIYENNRAIKKIFLVRDRLILLEDNFSIKEFSL